MRKLKLFSLLFGICIILTLTMFIKAGDVGILSNLILKIRINKSLTLLVGSFSIGFATYIMQRFTRNNIVDSSFFGIASFNILVLVIVYSVFSSSTDINTIYKWWMPFISLVASVSIALLLSMTIMKSSKAKSKNVILAGIIMNYTFTALAYFYLKFLNDGSISDILNLSFGAINEGYSYIILIVLFVLQIGTIIWYQLIYKKINVTNINLKLAESLGNNTKRINIQQIVITGINVAIGFALLGGVAFVGVLAAGFARTITKKSRWSAVVSGLCAIFITALSYLIMNGFAPLYYPIGITTTIVTIPYFIYKIIRNKNG